MPNNRKGPFLLDRICDGTKVNTIHCAQFKNEAMKEAGYRVFGHAWKPQNTRLIHSGYKGVEKPKSFVTELVERYNDTASTNFQKDFDSATLDTTRMYDANMYFKGSEYLERAFKEGQGVTGTHTGVVKWENTTPQRRGYWNLVHNIGGNVHVEPFTKTQGGGKKWGVTAIYEPEKSNALTRGVDKVKGVLDPNRFQLETLRKGGTLSFLVPMINQYKTNNRHDTRNK